jgi:hypothetical protein
MMALSVYGIYGNDPLLLLYQHIRTSLHNYDFALVFLLRHRPMVIYWQLLASMVHAGYGRHVIGRCYIRCKDMKEK